MRIIKLFLLAMLGFGLIQPLAAARDLSATILEIKGAKVATQAEAKQIAFDHYTKKMKANILAIEGVKGISIVTLGYNIPGFASKGDKIWEIRILTIENELRSILWVHSETGKVYFVIGNWDEPLVTDSSLSSARKILSETTSIIDAIQGEVPAGYYSEEIRAFNLIYSSEKAAEVFNGLYPHSRTAGKFYCLVGLYLLKDSAFEALKEDFLRTEQEKVRWQSGCEIANEFDAKKMFDEPLRRNVFEEKRWKVLREK